MTMERRCVIITAEQMSQLENKNVWRTLIILERLEKPMDSYKKLELSLKDSEVLTSWCLSMNVILLENGSFADVNKFR